MWTVYDRPKDHPEGFIARMFESAAGRTNATDKTLTGERMPSAWEGLLD